MIAAVAARRSGLAGVRGIAEPCPGLGTVGSSVCRARKVVFSQNVACGGEDGWALPPSGVALEMAPGFFGANPPSGSSVSQFCNGRASRPSNWSKPPTSSCV